MKSTFKKSKKQLTRRNKTLDEIRHHLDVLAEYRDMLKKRLRTNTQDKNHCMKELDIIDQERERLIQCHNILTER